MCFDIHSMYKHTHPLTLFAQVGDTLCSNNCFPAFLLSLSLSLYLLFSLSFSFTLVGRNFFKQLFSQFSFCLCIYVCVCNCTLSLCFSFTLVGYNLLRQLFSRFPFLRNVQRVTKTGPFVTQTAIDPHSHPQSYTFTKTLLRYERGLTNFFTVTNRFAFPWHFIGGDKVSYVVICSAWQEHTATKELSRRPPRNMKKIVLLYFRWRWKTCL